MDLAELVWLRNECDGSLSTLGSSWRDAGLWRDETDFGPLGIWNTGS